MIALDALGNPVRRTILEALRHQPMTVGEIASLVPTISRPAVSRHLKLLREAELVRFRTEGRTNVYVVRPEGFASVRDYLAVFWDEALPRFAHVAEAQQEDP
ncbi:MAG: metalloregulator ArsR/SmtB family transcription factor [Myxococcales bacterium]|nr:metalloregulator ArsR/SmtB family transcription factor [Myxococcales bacterium]